MHLAKSIIQYLLMIIKVVPRHFHLLGVVSSLNKAYRAPKDSESRQKHSCEVPKVQHSSCSLSILGSRTSSCMSCMSGSLYFVPEHSAAGVEHRWYRRPCSFTKEWRFRVVSFSSRKVTPWIERRIYSKNNVIAALTLCDDGENRKSRFVTGHILLV